MKKQQKNSGRNVNSLLNSNPDEYGSTAFAVLLFLILSAFLPDPLIEMISNCAMLNEA